jgi:hypothetical protein
MMEDLLINGKDQNRHKDIKKRRFIFIFVPYFSFFHTNRIRSGCKQCTGQNRSSRYSFFSSSNSVRLCLVKGFCPEEWPKKIPECFLGNEIPAKKRALGNFRIVFGFQNFDAVTKYGN